MPIVAQVKFEVDHTRARDRIREANFHSFVRYTKGNKFDLFLDADATASITNLFFEDRALAAPSKGLSERKRREEASIAPPIASLSSRMPASPDCVR